MNNTVVVKKIVANDAVGQSRQIDKDPFTGLYNNGVIAPLYDPELLIRLPEQSDILQQCIEAYKTNIVGFGYSFKYDIDYDKSDEATKKQLDLEWNKYDNFFKYCNFDESFVEIMKKVIDDREKLGWGAIEVIPDGLNNPAGFEHIPGHTLRMCKREDILVDIDVVITDENGKEVTIKRKKKFRKFVQIRGINTVYFKEFGDPRDMDCNTGEYGENIPEERKATSIMFFNIYCPYTEYGLPRYLGNVLNLQGSRKAQELNYNYFDDGRHIPLAIVVENGQLTQSSIDMLKNSKGESAQHGYLVLEAEGFKDGDGLLGTEEKSNKVNIRFEKLAEILQDDALFQEYCKNNRTNIRSAYRLPPIYTGESQDYNKATADTARQLTEEQVFQPEREDLGFRLNNLLKTKLEIKNVSMFLKSPRITDNGEIARALYPYITCGAATPNMVLDAMGQLLGKEFEQFEGDWANQPLQITLKELELQKQAQQLQNAVQKSDENGILEALKDIQLAVEGALGDE
ncbi:hypothetical protein Ccar_16590 [Clostridium carboxidivorans P7]|uniref:phage portal protein n=1 Tax=Clostridium carboxidivorans TaxID=217159 RepID=UPI00064E22A0|nr:phage portal protein [Clostridium carboxidivorans]AKN32390.1 hypothetical protein Ccar_16590 [Clostridium carboxidivorans P7]